MAKLIPEGELTFHDFDSCMKVAEIILEEGYVVLVSREENLYVINYVWSSENYADRNDVVFMGREEFDDKFYEEDEIEDEYDREQKIRYDVRNSTEKEVWYYAQKLMNASVSTIEKLFGLDQMSEEAQDRFWTMYPNQITYDEVKARYQEYNELRNAALGERIMDACLADLDKHNEEKYEREKQREEYQCEGQYVMEEFDDQST